MIKTQKKNWCIKEIPTDGIFFIFFIWIFSKEAENNIKRIVTRTIIILKLEKYTKAPKMNSGHT